MPLSQSRNAMLDNRKDYVYATTPNLTPHARGKKKKDKPEKKYKRKEGGIKKDKAG